MQFWSPKESIFFVVLHLSHCRFFHHFQNISSMIMRVGSSEDTKCMRGLRKIIFSWKKLLFVPYLSYHREYLYQNMLTATLKGASISVFASLIKCKLSLYDFYVNLFLSVCDAIFKYRAICVISQFVKFDYVVTYYLMWLQNV